MNLVYCNGFSSIRGVLEQIAICGIGIPRGFMEGFFFIGSVKVYFFFFAFVINECFLVGATFLAKQYG